jgi:hypothetical protein
MDADSLADSPLDEVANVALNEQPAIDLGDGHGRDRIRGISDNTIIGHEDLGLPPA